MCKQPDDMLIIDECLHPIIDALNGANIKTVASCCGHKQRPGNIVLDDGRELFIMPDYDSSRELDKLFKGINGEPAKVQGIVDSLFNGGE
jgi:hypothetical protein